MIYISVLGQRRPSISWITKEIVMDIGATVSLECSVQYAQDYPVLWVKKGSDGIQDLPISTNTALIVRDPRYNLRHEQSSSTYILEIRDLQENDGGEYMCQVLIDVSNRISASVPLLVRRPPIISDNSTRSVVVSEGTPVKLECYAGGVPIPKVYWRRENNALLPTGGSVFSAQKPFVYQALLFDAILECRVESYPPAAISWIFNSESLVNNQHYEISQFATADEFTDTTLRVKSIEKRQYGNYFCKANNKLGGFQARITLNEFMVPNINYHGILMLPSYASRGRSKSSFKSSSVLFVCLVFSRILYT
ncbi:Lachesin [Armadillidium nasatum]|uniref:Lachesin n=1 Tax=Armadillidium nasatum TaxID=96803 RepID=A0A5N5T7W4_9CRUS|nr:Lachesin [Armadillidium nasatum]